MFFYLRHGRRLLTVKARLLKRSHNPQTSFITRKAELNILLTEDRQCLPVEMTTQQQIKPGRRPEMFGDSSDRMARNPTGNAPAGGWVSFTSVTFAVRIFPISA
jgi:hypothetical protein